MISLSARGRRVAAKIPAWSVLAAAAALVWLLSSRGMLSTLSKGYAESQTYSVAPLRAGRVKSVVVDVGQEVKAGDVVATLDPRELDARLERLRADATRLDRQSERARMELLLARAGAERDRAELSELTAQLARLEGLAVQKLVAAREVEAVRLRRSAVAARVASLGGAEPAREGSPQPVPSPLALQAALLAELAVERENLTLRAPVDGAVSAITRRAGETVAAGAEVASLVTSRPGYVITWVHEKLARNIRPGMDARLQRAEFLGRSFSGRVVGVSPQLDEFPIRFRPGPTVPVWGRRVIIQVQDAERLLPGELFHVSF